MTDMTLQIENQKSKIEDPSPEWDHTRQWVESETGMDLSGPRFSRLRDAVNKSVGRQDASAALRSVLSRPDQQTRFLEQLTGQLTVGESFFFRNEHHFRALHETVVPQILEENAGRRELRAWSAGCATGEEPHSLAILFDQLLKKVTGWQVSVLGTDLNTEFLQRAREARYRPWSFRQTDIHQNRTYFTPVGDAFELAARVREQVRFAYLNLVKDVYPSPLTGTVGLDLILFRNVAIYLKPEVTAAILHRFYHALRPGGWLLLGESEVTAASPGDFEVHRLEQATLFRKPKASPPSSVDNATASLPPAMAGVPLPIAASEIRLPNVPALPEWVPLPRLRQAASDATRSAEDGVNSELVTWESILRVVVAGNLEDAERRVERITSSRARSALRLRLVRALLERAEVTRARRLLELCLKEEPLSFEAQLLTSVLAEEAGNLASAEQACRRALYINPNAPLAHFHLALILDQKGDRPAVQRSLRTTLKLIEGHDSHALVEFGDGVCYGRLKEMVSLMMSK